MAECVTIDKDGHLLLIGVNCSPILSSRNAWNLETFAEVVSAYETLADDPHLRVGVVYGHGDHFSTGLDMNDVIPALRGAGPEALIAGRFDPFGLWADPVPKPIVLAVKGVAFTLSIELALASDIVVAADSTRFRQFEVGRGLIPFGGATFRAPAQLGWGNAMRFLLTGGEFDAIEAHRIGLVQEVVPAGQELARAIEIAKQISKQAPLSVQGTLANARAALRVELENGPRAHLRSVLASILDSSDAAEGMQSYVENREPNFQGR